MRSILHCQILLSLASSRVLKQHFLPFVADLLINVDTASEHNNNRDFPSHLFFSSIIPVQLQADSQSNPTKHNNTTECRHESSEYCVAFTTQE